MPNTEPKRVFGALGPIYYVYINIYNYMYSFLFCSIIFVYIHFTIFYTLSLCIVRPHIALVVSCDESIR